MIFVPTLALLIPGLLQEELKYQFALERIHSDKKIFYYGGAFELYNPFPIIEKWENRLSKIRSK